MPLNPYFRGRSGHKYSVNTWFEHLVYGYTGLSFDMIQDLDYLDWLYLRRDAFINALNQTETGQEYLDKAYLLEQTEPDRKALRKRFGAEEVSDG